MYCLTFHNGVSIEFHLLSCAEIYQQCYGGVIVHTSNVALAA